MNPDQLSPELCSSSSFVEQKAANILSQFFNLFISRCISLSKLDCREIDELLEPDDGIALVIIGIFIGIYLNSLRF